MRILLPTAFFALLLSACSFLGFGAGKYQPNPDPNHTHADVAVFIEGMQLDFSDAKYMSGLSTDDTTHDEEDEVHHKYFHLHDELGHVIHRHKPGLTLGEFFVSLGFRMTANCLRLDTSVDICPDDQGKRWHLFVQNAASGAAWEEVAWDPSHVFADMDQILLTYDGEEAASRIRMEEQRSAMTEDACRYSQTCPWKGEPPTENCIADPEVPCVVPLK